MAGLNTRVKILRKGQRTQRMVRGVLWILHTFVRPFSSALGDDVGALSHQLNARLMIMASFAAPR